MSDDEQITETITAEFKDGQLQIVEVSPSGMNSNESDDDQGEEILSDLPSCSNDGEVKRFVEVVDPNGKGVMRLDLMNLTFIRCGDEDDDQGEYQLVTSEDIIEEDRQLQGETVSCVLAPQPETTEEEQSQTYVVVNDQIGSLMLVQPEHAKTEKAQSLLKKTTDQVIPPEQVAPPQETNKKKRKRTPQELIEKVKALQKIKAQIAAPPTAKRGRKCASDVPAPHELLASPGFKLFLYSCKYCQFKCNAVKELTAHKNREHPSGASPYKGHAKLPAMQCARCPYRAASQPQLMKHAREKHLLEVLLNKNSDDTVDESNDVNVLVCGGCGFESTSKNVFKDHIQKEHMTVNEDQSHNLPASDRMTYKRRPSRTPQST